MNFNVYKDLTTFNYEKEPYPDDSSNGEAPLKETVALSGGIIYTSDEGTDGTFNVYAKDKDLYVARTAPFEKENMVYFELDFSKACSKAKTFMVNSAIRKQSVEERLLKIRK